MEDQTIMMEDQTRAYCNFIRWHLENKLSCPNEIQRIQLIVFLMVQCETVPEHIIAKTKEKYGTEEIIEALNTRVGRWTLLMLRRLGIETSELDIVERAANPTSVILDL